MSPHPLEVSPTAENTSSPTFDVQPLLPEAYPSPTDWAAEVARLTRAAFQLSSPWVPGLPTPGGASEMPAAVLKDLARGVRVWVARRVDAPAVAPVAGQAGVRGSHGESAGVVRALPAEPGTWEVKRLGVLPEHRRQGVATRLLRAVEEAAAQAGVGRLRLFCVVERHLPPFYARLGYRIVARQPHPDRPLTVVTMERELGETPCPLTPWQAEGALPAAGVYVLWLWLPTTAHLPRPLTGGSLLPPGLYAYVGSAQRGLASRLRRHVLGPPRTFWHIDHLRRLAQVVGVDVRPGAPRSDECWLAARLAEAAGAVAGAHARDNAEEWAGGPAEDPPTRPNLAGSRPPGFGAGDCRCPGHLIGFGSQTDLALPFTAPRSFDPQLVAVLRLPIGA